MLWHFYIPFLSCFLIGFCFTNDTFSDEMNDLPNGNLLNLERMGAGVPATIPIGLARWEDAGGLSILLSPLAFSLAVVCLPLQRSVPDFPRRPAE